MSVRLLLKGYIRHKYSCDMGEDNSIPDCKGCTCGLSEALSALAQECEWSKDDDDFEIDVWHSDCGVAWEFTEGGPKENHYIYCHGCGKRIKEVEE